MEQRSKNIFADKATLILRQMIKQPDKKWVVRDFVGSQLISLGMASEVLLALEKAGYVEREKKGAFSFTILTNKNKLIQDWTKFYDFRLNTVKLFYNPKLKLNALKDFFKQRNIEDRYALTLHTGANFTTSYVKTENIYLYIDKSISDKVFLDFIQQLNLKQLVHGGNVYLVTPYYKTSVFHGSRKIRGFTIVSNLQLYLDLYHFQPRGAEHAEFLKEQLEQKGLALD
ncbi:MAG TPA: type IV toxin-antitoxin system AbiEi family antitoxin [Candidatus Kapabacteria bacterium]|nr:type IV toxin-antitoxin system AbiEi family antitoxin [Candidatus Kapabacteria bacterium]